MTTAEEYDVQVCIYTDTLNESGFVVAVKKCCTIGKKDMALNDYPPNISVDPETHRVVVDGVHLICEPAEVPPLAQLHNLL